MALDYRYMKLGRGVGSTWFFVYSIPPELRGLPQFQTRNGKPMTKITESLGTTDREKAFEARDERVKHWRRQFRMLREGPSEDDIREEQVEIYRTALKAEAKGGISTTLPMLRNPFQEQVEDYPRALDSSIEYFAQDEIDDYCKRAGITLERRTEPYRKLGIAFIEAKIAAGMRGVWLPLPDGRIRYGDEQRLPPLPKVEPPDGSERPAPPLPVPPLTRRETETFSEAFEAYQRTELDGISAETIEEYQRKVNILIAKIGDLPLNKITDHIAVDFLDKYLLRERKLKPKTRNGYALLFSAIFKSAMRRKKANHNPFSDQQVKAEAVHYEPFTDEEIVTLFSGMPKPEISPDKHKTATALPWISLISAYTGCRLEEAAQLKASDIKQSEGIWHFAFCHEGNGKTKAATRTVPLHHALIDAGLLRYRDALPSSSPLFPGLKSFPKGRQTRLSSSLGDMFRWWRQKLGVVRPGLNFHSFRHTVGDRLRRAGVQESDIAALLGHEDERITSRVYGHNGPGLPRLREVVERLSYKGLLPSP
jgi:integrase